MEANMITFLEFRHLGMTSFINVGTSRWKWLQCVITKGYPYASLKRKRWIHKFTCDDKKELAVMEKELALFFW
jgi:hypothetical protein